MYCATRTVRSPLHPDAKCLCTNFDHTANNVTQGMTEEDTDRHHTDKFEEAYVGGFIRDLVWTALVPQQLHIFGARIENR